MNCGKNFQNFSDSNLENNHNDWIVHAVESGEESHEKTCPFRRPNHLKMLSISTNLLFFTYSRGQIKEDRREELIERNDRELRQLQWGMIGESSEDLPSAMECDSRRESRPFCFPRQLIPHFHLVEYDFWRRKIEGWRWEGWDYLQEWYNRGETWDWEEQIQGKREEDHRDRLIWKRRRNYFLLFTFFGLWGIHFWCIKYTLHLIAGNFHRSTSSSFCKLWKFHECAKKCWTLILFSSEKLQKNLRAFVCILERIRIDAFVVAWRERNKKKKERGSCRDEIDNETNRWRNYARQRP